MHTLVAFGSFPHPKSSNLKKLAHRPICSLRKQSKISIQNAWPALSLSLFGSGFFLGPLIDGLHSRVNLVVYQNGAIDIGPLHTNIWLIIDEKLSPEAPPQGTADKTAASLIALVVLIEVSAEMYKAGVADNIEPYILFGLAETIWVLLDRTKLGFALACAVGLVCPLAEIPIMKFYHLWYYPQPNVEIFGQGLVTWTLTCYFAYTPFLINLSRWLKTIISTSNDEDG